MLSRLHRRQRAVARRVLALFVAFWGVTAVTPCVMAAPADAGAHHAHQVQAAAGAHGGCDTLMHLDCQTADKGSAQVPGPVAHVPPLLPVLAYALLPADTAPATESIRSHSRAAEVAARPPLILQYVVLLI